MLIDARMPDGHWGAAFTHANYLRNVSVVPASTSVTPHQSYHKSVPDLSHLRVFGCDAYVHVPAQKRGKLDARSLKGKFLGFAPGAIRGYRVLVDGKVHTSTNVIFDEADHHAPASAPPPHLPTQPSLSLPTPALPLTLPAWFHTGHVVQPLPQPQPAYAAPQHAPHAAPQPAPHAAPQPAPHAAPQPQPHAALQPEPHPAPPPAPQLADHPHAVPQPAPLVAPQPEPQPALPPVPLPAPQLADQPHAAPQPDAQPEDFAAPGAQPRPARARTQPDYFVPRGCAPRALSAVTAAPGDAPTTLSTAMAGPDADQWRQAMAEEHASLMEHQTWTLVPQPPNIKPIGCKWVYKRKRDEHGNIERYKARLVAKGFEMVKGVHYTGETFAPVGRYTSIRAFFAVVAHHGLVCRQLDVKTAYLHGRLPTPVYMREPPGMETRVPPGSPPLVCRVTGSLYGLPEAGHLWNGVWHDAMLALGFTRSAADPSMYFLRDATGNVLCVVYVDDSIIAGSTLAAVQRVIDGLQRYFRCEDQGEPALFLNIKVTRDKRAGTITLSQPHVIRDLVARFGLDDARPRNIPMATGVYLARA